MRDRDAALDSAIHEVAAILGDALVSGCSSRIRPSTNVTCRRQRALM